MLQDAAAERKFHDGVHLQPVHKLRYVVVGVLVHHLGKVAYTISIHHGLALELSTNLEASAETFLRDKASEAETEVWAEVFHLNATSHITIIVDRNLVIANLYVILFAFSNILFQLIAMACNLHQFIATHREAAVTKNELALAKG